MIADTQTGPVLRPDGLPTRARALAVVGTAWEGIAASETNDDVKTSASLCMLALAVLDRLDIEDRHLAEEYDQAHGEDRP